MEPPTVQALVGFGAFLVGFGLGLLVLFTAPGRAQNRLLAAALLFESTAMFTFGAMGVATDPATLAALYSLNVLMAPLVACFYLAFLGTLDSPFSRLLGSPAAIAALCVIAAGVALAWPLLFPFDTRIVLWPLAAVMAFGLLVAATSLARARTTLARRRARAVLVAFGFRDALTIPLLLGLLPSIEIRSILIPLAALVSFLMLGYGALSLQLFDVDLRIKRTLRRGTVAAVFLATFFVVSELAAALLTDRIGTIAGIVGAGLLVFFLAPLQRVADRFSDRAMPGTHATPVYVAFRKLEVYKATVEEVMADGRVTEKERRTLDRLRDKLDIAVADAEAIERDHAARRGGA